VFAGSDENTDVVATLERIGRRMVEMMLSDLGLTIYRVVVAEARKFPELANAFYNAGPARAIAESELRFRLAFENNLAGMVLHDHEGRFLEANDAFCQIVGYSLEELTASGSSLFIDPDDAELAAADRQQVFSQNPTPTQRVRRYRHKSGRVVYVDVSRSAVRDDQGRVLFTMTSVRDVTAERSLTEQLSYQALHDSLTGLPNRTLLMDRIAHAHQRHLRRGGINALILFDLDDFKSINDNYGHNVGDNVLVVFAHRLEKAMRSSDTLCRLAGDEFIYLARSSPQPVSIYAQIAP